MKFSLICLINSLLIGKKDGKKISIALYIELISMKKTKISMITDDLLETETCIENSIGTTCIKEHSDIWIFMRSDLCIQIKSKEKVKCLHLLILSRIIEVLFNSFCFYYT